MAIEYSLEALKISKRNYVPWHNAMAMGFAIHHHIKTSNITYSAVQFWIFISRFGFGSVLD